MAKKTATKKQTSGKAKPAAGKARGRARATPISAPVALIYTMVLVSAVDREMSDNELAQIGQDVMRLPAFRDFDSRRLPLVAADCAALLNSEDGFETVLDLIATALPDRLRETAYALACEIAAADGRILQEVSRLLELLRNRLGLGRLVTAAIERGARARAMPL